MAQRQANPGHSDEPTALFDGAFRLVVVLGVVLVALMAIRLVADGGRSPSGDGRPAGLSRARVHRGRSPRLRRRSMSPHT